MTSAFGLEEKARLSLFLPCFTSDCVSLGFSTGSLSIAGRCMEALPEASTESLARLSGFKLLGCCLEQGRALASLNGN